MRSLGVGGSCVKCSENVLLSLTVATIYISLAVMIFCLGVGLVRSFFQGMGPMLIPWLFFIYMHIAI